jgi:hypothetical protein
VISAGWDILSFAQQAQSLTGGNLEFTTLPIARFEKVNGQDVNKVDVDQVRAAVHTAFGQTTPPPPSPSISASATIDVRNATGRTGLASSVAQALAPYGFRTGDLGNVTKADATTAASLLGGLAATADSRLPQGRIRITLGDGFVLPATLGPHGADAPPGTPATTAPTTDSPAPPSSSGPQGGAVDGRGIPCVN